MLGSLFSKRALDLSAWAAGADSSFYPMTATSSGQSVTQDSSLNLLTVYGCTSFISNTISTLPAGMLDEDKQAKPDPRWLRMPNPEVDWVDFVVQVVSSLLLDGNAYLAVVRDARGQVGELWALDPQKVEVLRTTPGARPVYRVNGVPYPGELRHIRGLIRAGQLKGMSPVEAARQSIGLGMGALEHGGKLFGQGTTMAGVIEVPGALDQNAAERLRNNWLKFHSGSSKSHLPGVLTEGATWKGVSLTNEQAQFLETRGFTAAEIAGQMFLMDPTLLGIPVETKGALTYQNIEQRGVHLVQFTLLHWLIRLERAFTSLDQTSGFFKFNVAALLRADLKSRYESYRMALDPTAPFLTVDEVRDYEDKQPMPETAPVEPAGVSDGSV